MQKFARIIIKQRLLIVAGVAVITLFFAYQVIVNLRVSTVFSDLLPQKHPFINVHKDFRKLFGGANFLVIMVQVKTGDIFNTATLKKVQYITEKLETIPGVDPYKIISIASRKLKDLRISSWGMESVPLMYPHIPEDEDSMNCLKNAIYANEMYYGLYVSFDAQKTLIFADFFEEDMDYTVVYNALIKIRNAVEDENTTVCMVGNPIHLGIVADMTTTMNYIIAATMLFILFLLYITYRSFWAMIIVPLSGFVSLVWGLGFMALMRFNLDPLIFGMPFLIALMAFRHSLQLYNRYYEEFIKDLNGQNGCRVIIEQMFLPGVTGIVTDAFGIGVIAIVAVPVLQNISLACAFSSVVTVIIGLILTPILLSYIPVSAHFLRHIERQRLKGEQRIGFSNRFADWLGPWLIGRGRFYVVIAVVFIVAFSGYWSEKLIVGDAQVGSNLLRPDSRYNRDAEAINRNLPMINPLYIVAAGDKRDVIKNVRVLKDVEQFSRFMAQHSGAVGTQTIIDIIKNMGRKFHEDDPKWLGFPDTIKETEVFFTQAATMGDPGDMDKFIDYHDKYTNIVVFFKDKTGPTIQRAVDTATQYIDTIADPGDEVTYKLAGGVIGVEAAVNDVVAEKQLQTLLLALSGVFIFCTINFRSWKIGLILTIPLVFSNFMAFAYMAINKIGLSLSTLPVSAAGIGMGVDYGIYLIARLVEEQRKRPSDPIENVLIKTIQTYGKSIIFIGGTLILGLLVWTLSPLKFQAQMGLMLAVILFLNCLGAIFLVPVLVLMLKPRCIGGTAPEKRQKDILIENISIKN